jgi:3-dehydroquinate synthase
LRPARIPVPLPGSPYEVHLGAGLLRAPKTPDPFFGSGGRLLLVADRGAAEHHVERILGALRSWGEDPEVEVIEPGEASKTPARALGIVERMIAAGFGRDDRIAVLGGGMAGDLAGFAASLYMRGVRFCPLPSTLLAQVDACVGGKVAVNYGGAKNLLGDFHQPSAVVIDPELLATLPGRHYRAGFAEVVKVACVGDPGLLEVLEENRRRLLERDPRLLATVIERCCRFKAEVVLQDETDRGRRKLLNFGHTVGHALESLEPGDGGFLHGEAVSVGIMAACLVAESLGLAPNDLRRRLEALLTSLDLPTRLDMYDPINVMNRIGYDKKLKSGLAGMVLTTRPGVATFDVPVPPDVLVSCLERLARP